MRYVLNKGNFKFFAPDDGATGGGSAEGQSTQAEEAKTFTQEEVEAMKAEWEKTTSEKHATEIEKAKQAATKEAERVAKLSADEKKAEELKNLQDKVADLEREKVLSALKEDARAVLEEQKLPSSFLNFVLGEDIDKTKENITTLKKVFDESVQATVEERLKGKTPESGGTGSQDNDIQAQFKAALRA